MRLQHAEKTAGTLPADTAGAGERQGSDRRGSRAPALADLERQGHGCQSHPRAHPRRHAGLPGRRGGRKRDPSSRRLWTALREIDRYLSSQSAWLVNYAERHRAGLRVGTSITEGTANFLVNRRMTKSQQMRWSRRGADLLLQVRCATSTANSAPPSDSSSKLKSIPLPIWPWLLDPQSFDGPLSTPRRLRLSCRRVQRPFSARQPKPTRPSAIAISKPLPSRAG